MSRQAAGFFGAVGDVISASSATELLQLLKEINIDVPPRGKGRTSAHRERYCLVKYLSHLLCVGRLEFPITVRRNQPDNKSPDFLLGLVSGRTVGLEHSDAGPESYQKADAIADADSAVVFLDLPYYSKHPRIHARKSLAKGFVSAGAKLQGDGWMNDEPERQWAQFIAAAIRKKRQRIKRGHYDHCDEYELLIYDNTPTMALNYGKALLALKARVRTTKPFVRVSVLDCHQVFHDVLGRTPVNRPSTVAS
ncbi:MAG: hypothetical protein HY216_03230 [Candidatus Rokubacteria bacterium]|nr:hypothetical protein [Candidatus Rokubacteria bacterium]